MIKILHRHTRELLFVYPRDTFIGQDLRGFNLEFADLSGQDLTEAIMEGMNLDETEFSYATLIGAKMARCSLREAIFDSTDLTEAKLDNCKFSMTAFVRAVLTRADFSGSDFEGVTNFTYAIAIGTKFRNIKKIGSPIFENIDCGGADFTGTDLTVISEGDILDANFEGAVLDPASKEYLEKILRKEIK
ncbi:MAG: pentapeptide repeat-containing protein [Candidatus Yanofskybacteria bacterium]|nr:pentapeptide repeat-containing protein [Candidatus Yanofskybacteria bacterium]